MNRIAKTLAVGAVVILGVLAEGKAQVEQAITFNLRLYDQTDTGVRTLKIVNKDIILNLVGTNVPGAKLFLVMPNEPTPSGDTGNIGAWLRVTDAKGNILAETDTTRFNIYQTVSTQNPTHIYAWNQFSLAFGGIGAEVFGTTTWTKNARTPGGQGSFHCTVSGTCGVGGTSNGTVPCTGSISGGEPKPTN